MGKKVERFDLTRDGTCPADRPKAERKNKKYIPSCKGTAAVSIHPFKKPEAYFKCMEEADQVAHAPPRRPLGQGDREGPFGLATSVYRFGGPKLPRGVPCMTGRLGNRILRLGDDACVER